MNKVKILTDSCSDLTVELMEKYGIDYAQMNTVYEGQTAPALLSWTDEDVHRFYGIMRDGKRITTTQVPVEEYNRVFKKYLDEGCDLVYIGCSTKQSGSVNTARIVSTQLSETYPNQKIFIIDSLNACYGEGILAIEAAKKAAEGKSAEEINEYILANLKKVLEFCTVHTLDYLKKAGRVKGSAAFFGNLMGVKPIIIADKAGNQSAFKKVKGRQNSFTEIVKLLKENIINPEEQTIYVAHADCSKEEVAQIVELIKSEIPCKEIYIGYIGPIIGASIGPDAIGIWAFGKEVEFNLGE